MSTYNPYLPRTVRGAPARRHKSRAPAIFVTIILIVGIVIAFVVSQRTSSQSTQAKSTPDIPQLPTPVAQLSPIEIEKSATLGRGVRDALAGTEGSYAVVIKHLKTGEYYAQQEEVSYDAASLYKLWVMAVIYEYIKAGRLTPQTQLSAEVADLNKTFKIASESAELTEGTISYTVSEALEQMIMISDNYAALLLTDAISRTAVADFLTRYGLTGSHVGNGEKPPVTTAADLSRLYEKLYSGQVVDADSSQAMIELLKRQRLNEKIPLELPDLTEVAHKTGELDGVSHDAGIVYAPGGEYVIVLLSRSEDRDAANARLAAISKAVYDHFESSPTNTSPASP